MASAVMGASVAEVDCSGLCGCMIPMLAVKAVIFCGGVFCTRRFRALQDSRPLQFVKKSTKFYRLSNRRLYALNDNVDVLKELGHLHEKMPLSVAVIFADPHQATKDTSMCAQRCAARPERPLGSSPTQEQK